MWIDAVGKFFGLSDRNKILALIIVFLGLSVTCSYKVCVYGLSIIDKYIERTDIDNVRLRTQLEKKEKECDEWQEKYNNCRHQEITKLDTLISLYESKNVKSSE